MKTIISTEHCHTGYSTTEECFVIGSYNDLYNSNEIEGDILWDYEAWEVEKQYFKDYLNATISAYEKKYKTTVTHIAMVGNVETWRGNFVGGKIIDSNDNPLEHMGDVDDIEVVVDNQVISIYGHHHDGCHCLELYLLTENKLQKYAPGMVRWNDYDHNDLQRIKNNCSPIKHITKEQRAFFGAA